MSYYPDIHCETETFEHDIVRLDPETEEVSEEFTVEAEWEVEYTCPHNESRFRFDVSHWTIESVSFLQADHDLTDEEVTDLESEAKTKFLQGVEAASPY